MSARASLRKLAVCLLAIALGCLATEAVVRWLAFGEGDLAKRWGAGLRRPRLFADSATADYWKLSQRIWNEPGPAQPHIVHPRLGWVSGRLNNATLIHEDESTIEGKRPVLLFGDSYAQCMTKRAQCFEGIFRETELASSHALINFGVRGYGVDQALLLMREVLPRFIDADPVVVLAFCVDDIADRCALDFRGWPKPRFRDQEGPLALEFETLPTLDEYLAAHPPDIWSYAWRALSRGSGIVPPMLRPNVDPTDTLVKRRALERVLTEIETELAARRVEHFFVLFPGPKNAIQRASNDWQETFPAEALERLEAPYVLGEPILHETALLEGCALEAFYGVEQPLVEHFNLVGNRAGMFALLQGLDRCYEPRRRKPVDARDVKWATPDDSRATICYTVGKRRAFESAEDRLCLRALPQLRTRIVWQDLANCTRFTATAGPMDHQNASDGCAGAELEILVELESVYRATIDHSTPPLPITIELAGADAMVIVVRDGAGASDCSRVVLTRPRFE